MCNYVDVLHGSCVELHWADCDKEELHVELLMLIWAIFHVNSV